MHGCLRTYDITNGSAIAEPSGGFSVFVIDAIEWKI